MSVIKDFGLGRVISGHKYINIFILLMSIVRTLISLMTLVTRDTRDLPTEKSLKKVCQSFENRNANVVSLQCQIKGSQRRPLRVNFAGPKGKI